LSCGQVHTVGTISTSTKRKMSTGGTTLTPVMKPVKCDYSCKIMCLRNTRQIAGTMDLADDGKVDM
jgi:hypothetical protein